MSYFAKVLNGKVIDVISADISFFDTFVDTTPGAWLQTSYNTRGGVHYGQDGQPDGGIALRANYAGVGYTYDSVNDVFYAPRPLDMNGSSCLSWTIGAPTWLWTPPIPYPKGNIPYVWDEATQSWITPALTVA